MRTTLTLDDDVAALLKQTLERRKDELRVVVNEALRYGLRRMSGPPERRATYPTPSIDTGRCLIPNVDEVAEVLAVAEGGWHK